MLELTTVLREKPQFAAPVQERLADAIGLHAIRALYREVALSPKPGLVSPQDAGSHTDMDYRTFLRSLYSLREYFPAIVRRGTENPAFSSLQELGLAAETTMLEATNGINTHRGAIFNLGLLCAAAGFLSLTTKEITAENLCSTVVMRWGQEILGSGQKPIHSHGSEVKKRYGYGGAREEAANGFPSVREVGLPTYRDTLTRTSSPELAAIQTLFALILHVDDTNLLWRGGDAGLAFARDAAGAFLARGGVFAHAWLSEAQEIHRSFVERNLSPGGSADLLGVTLFLDRM
jgi:triphosphoribosyl-dephospho-CoA synthase